MKAFIFLSTIAFFIIITTNLHGQDQIIKKDQTVIQCKVKEIGIDAIKYTVPEYPSDLIFSIDKSQLIKIIFSNGQEMLFQEEMFNPNNYVDNKKNAIKIDFLSPLTGKTTFSFERSIRPGRSWEATLGIIGLGVDVADNKAAGAFTRLGYKFLKSPDFYLRGMRYAHILKGSYIRPEFSLGYYTYERTYYDYSISYPYSRRTEMENNAFMSVMLNFGKQWIFDNSFLVDIYAGIGYGFDTDNYDDGYNFAMVSTSESSAFAFSAGLKIGLLFK